MKRVFKDRIPPRPENAPRGSKTSSGMGQVVTRSPLADKAHNDVTHSVRRRDRELELNKGNPDTPPKGR